MRSSVSRRIRGKQEAAVARQRIIGFDESGLTFNHEETLPVHANGMLFRRRSTPAGAELAIRIYYSVGGGFVVRRRAQRMVPAETHRARHTACRFHFTPAMSCSPNATIVTARLPASCVATSSNWRTDAEIDAGLLRIWKAM